MKQNTKVRSVLIVFSILATFFAHVAVVRPQPLRREILKDIYVEKRDDFVRVEMEFNFPIRYVNHFPQDKGDELRIRLEPLLFEDTRILLSRESIKIPYEIEEIVSEITYEGDIQGGPYLTVRFNEEVRYSVFQGSDFRSLVIEVRIGRSDSSSPSGKEESGQ